MASVVATQLVLYSDDSIALSYSDGSHLELTPCGSMFTYYGPPAAHPLHDSEKVQQRSQFVISAYQEQLQEAIDFRNRFAERPYINNRLVLEHQMSDVALVEATWPTSLTDAQTHIKHLSDGQIAIQAINQSASVCLSANRKHLTARYLASYEGGGSVWIVNHCSVHACPDHWRHAVTLLTDACHAADKPSVKFADKEGSITGDEHTNTCYQSSSSLADTSQQKTTAESQKQSSNAARTDLISPPPAFSNTDVSPSPNTEHRSPCTTHQSPDRSPTTTSITASSHVHLSRVSPDSPCITASSATHTCPNETSPSTHNNVTAVSSSSRSAEPLRFTGTTSPASQRVSTPPSPHTDSTSSSPLPVISTPLPSCLPVACKAQHLHQWYYRPHSKATSTDTPTPHTQRQARVKVLCSNGVIYRVFHRPSRSIQIYPGDGSILCSTGLAAHFFVHHIAKDGQLMDRMYAVDPPPMRTPGIPYCIDKLISTGARLLRQCNDEDLNLHAARDASVPCWQLTDAPSPAVDLPSHSQPVLLESCNIDNLARFTAFSNGRIRVVFADRTCMDMWASIDATMQPADQTVPLADRTCRLLLPNGHYQCVDVYNPQQYDKYVSHGIEWIRWVNTPADQRANFYQGTLYDPHQFRSIAYELKKIECFNYITDNSDVGVHAHTTQHINDTACTSTDGRTAHPTDTDRPAVDTYTTEMIQQIIKQNSTVAADIDELIRKPTST